MWLTQNVPCCVPTAQGWNHAEITHSIWSCKLEWSHSAPTTSCGWVIMGLTPHSATTRCSGPQSFNCKLCLDRKQKIAMGSAWGPLHRAALQQSAAEVSSVETKLRWDPPRAAGLQSCHQVLARAPLVLCRRGGSSAATRGSCGRGALVRVTATLVLVVIRPHRRLGLLLMEVE